MIEILITFIVFLLIVIGLCYKDIRCIKKDIDEMVRVQELRNLKNKVN